MSDIDQSPPADPTLADFATRRCPRCGTHFGCGANTDSRPCWCSALPVIDVRKVPEAGCLCPDCLAREVARQQAGRAD